MGRLTLNVLLSFAQFEREVTGERIRDKIAASKRKGMWMGGLVPLGYDVVDRKLVVNEDEAKTVRHIYAQYIDQGSVSRLKEVLEREGVRSKRRIGRDDRAWGQNRFTSGALFSIVTNPIYRGQIAHKGVCHPGQHVAIVPEDLWTQAQSLRERTRRKNSTLPRAQAKNPLLGLLTDEEGRAYQATFTTKGHRRYRYYVTKEKPADQQTRPRLPADELEKHVIDRMRIFFDSPKAVADVVQPKDAQEHKHAIHVSTSFAMVVPKPWEIYRPLLKQVELRPAEIAIHLEPLRLRQALGLDEIESDDNATNPVVLIHRIRLRRTAHELRLVVNSGGPQDEAARPNASLIRFLAKGRRWYRQLTSGEMPSIKAIATFENVTERYVARVLRGSLLAPDLIERILSGRQPVTLTVRQLLDPPPIDWLEQPKHFGFAV
jgi:site-specific DNA recombinase